MGLISKQKFVHSVYTELTLETDKSADGIEYPKINVRKVGDVENPEITDAYAKMIKPHLKREAKKVVQEG